MNWTAETDALVIQMEEQGLGDTDMSRRFLSEHGLVVSKNAIIGRRHRLRRQRAAMVPTDSQEEISKELQADPIEAQIEGCPLLDLGPLPPIAERCQWPLGPAMAKADLFCGGAITAPGHVYCREHHAVAFNGTTRRNY